MYHPYDPVCLVSRSVGWSVCMSFLKGGKLHFHAPIGALVIKKIGILKYTGSVPYFEVISLPNYENIYAIYV